LRSIPFSNKPKSGFTDDMRLHESVVDGIDVFALQGDIDLHYAPVLRSRLQTKIEARTPTLVLDLSKVDYIDSNGLATIMEYFRDAAKYGGILCMAGLNDHLKVIFEIVRLDKAIPMFATAPDAIGALKQGCVQRPSDALFNRPA
jgi:anti-sigma B factor antagonist